LINNKKVSGILTEMQAEQDKVSYVIIGIGINVNQKLSSYPKDLQSKVTSLNIEENEKNDKTKLIQNIIKSFEEKLDLYLKDGFPYVKTIWEQYGFRINVQLEITISNEYRSGLLIFIAEDGALLDKRDSDIIE